MDPSGIFNTLAEVSITLAGFSGLIAAFQYQRDWEPTNKTRLLNILVLSFLVVVCALLPSLLVTFFEDPGIAWRISLLLFAVVQLFIVLKFLIGVVRRSWAPAVPWLSLPVSCIGIVVGVVALLAALGFGIEATPSLLGLVLLWGLISAGLQFVLTLRAVWGE